MFGLQNITGTNNLEVQAIGHQWWWEFQLPQCERVGTADYALCTQRLGHPGRPRLEQRDPQLLDSGNYR